MLARIIELAFACDNYLYSINDFAPVMFCCFLLLDWHMQCILQFIRLSVFEERSANKVVLENVTATGIKCPRLHLPHLHRRSILP